MTLRRCENVWDIFLSTTRRPRILSRVQKFCSRTDLVTPLNPIKWSKKCFFSRQKKESIFSISTRETSCFIVWKCHDIMKGFGCLVFPLSILISSLPSKEGNACGFQRIIWIEVLNIRNKRYYMHVLPVTRNCKPHYITDSKNLKNVNSAIYAISFTMLHIFF